jgi:hypothetical protein
MLRSIKNMHGFRIQAKDGGIGKADEFYFDDHLWTIRYLIVDTGNWLISRRVLLSPHSFSKLDWEEKIFHVNLTKSEVENSPKIEKDKPVSHQHEIELTNYYGWPRYWNPIQMPLLGAVPPPLPDYMPPKAERELLEETKQKHEEEFDPHLRSTNAVIEYDIQVRDGNIGHVEDFLVDEDWTIRYMIIDTRNILPGGKKVILALPWIQDINASIARVVVNLTKEQVNNAPEYDSSKSIDRSYELALYEYYDKPKYWK